MSTVDQCLKVTWNFNDDQWPQHSLLVNSSSAMRRWPNWCCFMNWVFAAKKLTILFYKQQTDNLALIKSLPHLYRWGWGLTYTFMRIVVDCVRILGDFKSLSTIDHLCSLLTFENRKLLLKFSIKQALVSLCSIIFPKTVEILYTSLAD